MRDARDIELLGGVGKTTTAVNLATIYAGGGPRTLLIDLDPQASATDFFGLYDRAAAERRGAVELLYGNAPVGDVAFETEADGLRRAPRPSTSSTRTRCFLREQRLRFALDDCAGDYDVCIVDCSPNDEASPSTPTAAAGDGMVIVPVKLDSPSCAAPPPHGQRHRVHLRRAARAHTSMASCAPTARAHDQRRGDRGRRAGLLLPRKPVRHRHPREFEGLRGGSWQWQPVAAFKPNSRPAKGLRGARRGGAPWLNRSTSGFTISGLLDRNASTRSDYPVEGSPVGAIADHPPTPPTRWTRPASRSSRKA